MCFSRDKETQVVQGCLSLDVFLLFPFVHTRFVTKFFLQKKICEALTSKLRSTGKQDEHVFQYRENHPCESDWELL